MGFSTRISELCRLQFKMTVSGIMADMGQSLLIKTSLSKSRSVLFSTRPLVPTGCSQHVGTEGWYGASTGAQDVIQARSLFPRRGRCRGSKITVSACRHLKGIAVPGGPTLSIDRIEDIDVSVGLSGRSLIHGQAQLSLGWPSLLTDRLFAMGMNRPDVYI